MQENKTFVSPFILSMSEFSRKLQL